MPTPIVLSIYDKNDELKKTYSRSIIKYGLVKKAMRLMADIKALEAEADAKAATIQIRKHPKTGLAKFLERLFSPIVRLWKYLYPSPLDESDDERGMAPLEDFVVEFFGNGLQRRDLVNCDYGELMAVLVAVLARSNESATKFPTFPQGGRGRKR